MSSNYARKTGVVELPISRAYHVGTDLDAKPNVKEAPIAKRLLSLW